jgi:endonuclease YncB( thermonuclease family)
VRLEADIEERDRYGRRLAYVVVDGERFNDELLRSGYARLLVIEPNHTRARIDLAVAAVMAHARAGDLASRPRATIYLLD